ncbi:hypothetical protein M413DRAFT_88334 [Hebeloma cylindrosporum]|uniref:Uncharacterized protein n=1 Tax=Hebeloma cylindrosporum TaxID=76867 RepID=A0A0C3CYD6_HEBCY|nr:hypothetical protein M413DRAFT_88334 [Hebeloma cylindrosporum h7]
MPPWSPIFFLSSNRDLFHFSVIFHFWARGWNSLLNSFALVIDVEITTFITYILSALEYTVHV